MLKRIFVVLVLIFTVSICMSSCQVVAEPQTDSQPVTTVTTTTTVPVPTTTEVNKDAISMKLAQLIDEDGTGEINLEMTLDEIADVLDKYDIPYEIDEIDTICPADGSCLAAPDLFSLIQTKKGLKIGDPAGKALVLYKTPIDKGENFYVFNTGKTSYGVRLELAVHFENSLIDSIILRVHEEFYGGAGGIY